MIVKEVGSISPYDFDCKLKDIKLHIDSLIMQYGENAELVWDGSFHYAYDSSPSPRYEINIHCEETDDEFSARIAVEQAQKDARDLRDLAEMKRLQAYFDSKDKK